MSPLDIMLGTDVSRRHELRDLLADVVAERLTMLSDYTQNLLDAVERERDARTRGAMQEAIETMRCEWKTIAAGAVLGKAMAGLR